MNLDRFSLLLGSRQFAAISCEASSGRTVHAYLIEGDEGAGKRSFALLLAAALLCGAEKRPCLDCNVCRRVLAVEHPDVHIYQSDKKTVSVDDMRSLAAQSVSSSYEGGKRVFIICGADTMTQQAQNCLLKTLEEPEGSAVFVLLAKSAEQLLTTVRSRCRRVRLSDFPTQAISAQLALLGTPDAAAAANSCGNIGKAIALVGAGEVFDKADRLLALSDRGDYNQVLSLLNKDDAAELLSAAETVTAQRLRRNPSDKTQLCRLQSIFDAQRRIKGNINFGLTAGTLAAELCEPHGRKQ